MKIIGGAFLGFGIFCALVLLGLIPILAVSYSGKEVFRTDEEYVAFKEVVGQEGISLKSAVVLSSDVPVVVDFKVKVPKGMDFPYGHVDVFEFVPIWAFMVVGLTLGGILLFIRW